MKKLSVLFTVICLILCGCSLKTPHEKVAEAIAIPINITFEVNSGVWNAVITADGYTAVLLDGDTAELTLKSGANGTTAEAGGFTREVDGAMFPAVQRFIKAVRAANNAEALTAESEGLCEYAIDEMQIMVYYDSDSGLITNIGTEDRLWRFDYRVITVGEYEGTGDGEGRS